MAEQMDASMELVLASLDEWFSNQLSRLSNLADKLQDQLAFDEAGHLEVSDSVRRRLKPIATKYLEDNPVVDGCGLIFGHEALGTKNGHLEWWVREDEARFARYSFGVVPGGDRYYDYEQHDWFIRAFSEGVAALEGPYIDYLGVEAYVLTVTMPAVVEGKRIGAVGNDIQIDDLEAILLPMLLQTERPAAIVNRHGNVLFSNTPELLTGEHLSQTPEGFSGVKIPGSANEMRLFYSLGSPLQ